MQGIDRRHQGLSDVSPMVGSTVTSLTLTLVTMDPRTLQQVISSVSSRLLCSLEHGRRVFH